MTNTFVGANPDDLDRVAGQVERSARKLTAMQADVASQLRSSSWVGSDAEAYMREWTRSGTLKLNNAATLLEAAASALRRNADQQRRTSEAVTGDFTQSAGGNDPNDPNKAHDPNPGQESLDDWAEDEGRDDALRLRDASDAEQLAWWNSLTKDEQQAMLEHHPELLLGLALPTDVLANANASAIANLAETIAVGEQGERGELWAGGKVWGIDAKIAAGIEAKMTTFADGTTEVKLALDAEVSAGIGGKAPDSEVAGSLGLKGEAARTYTFDSPEEAQKFIDAMKSAVKPDSNMEKLEAGFGVVAPPVGGNYVVGEFKEVLDRYDGHYKESTLKGELNGDVTVQLPGVGEAKIEGGAGVEYNVTDGSTKAYVAVKGSADIDLPQFQGESTGDMELAVKWDKDGNLEEVKVTGTYDHKGGQGVSNGPDGPLAGKVLAGTGGSFEAALDLSDKGNRDLAMDLIRSVGKGDVRDVAGNFGDVYDASTVVVQQHVSAKVSGEVDAVVVGGSYENTSKQAVLTTVKPPHGDLGILKVKK